MKKPQPDNEFINYTKSYCKKDLSNQFRR